MQSIFNLEIGDLCYHIDEPDKPGIIAEFYLFKTKFLKKIEKLEDCNYTFAKIYWCEGGVTSHPVCNLKLISR